MEIVYVLIPMILALSVHEYFHAWVAAKLGDDTAIRHGRLTLNPVAHIDPIGTLLIPIVGLSTGMPFIGWAKPVPISPIQFTRRFSMKTGVLLVSAAGPLSNLVFGFLMALVLSAVAHVVGIEELINILATNQGITAALVQLMRYTIFINIGLFIFNLLPIPPLDGSGVLQGFLPDRYRHYLDSMAKYSFIFLIAILVVGGRFIGYPIFWIVEGLSSIVGIERLFGF
ncbi:MAG: site-2 protease family protein [Deltaproteobacteria bacterium]|nr:site-2 protease family protein [Deltaproteobacteria bacterium]MBW1872473.1 site-2 protease family protein [Deltaproteobacteria bacterium]